MNTNENHYYYVEQLKAALKNRTIIFIDAANLERSVQDMWVNPKEIPDNLKEYSHDKLCWRVDYEKFKSFFAAICALQEIRFYSAAFGTKAHKNFLLFLKHTLGFTVRTKPLKQYDDHTTDHPQRKANFDVEIGIDATDCLNIFDTFILFSGDCDFEYLLKYLRGKNKIAITFSRTGHVAKELPPASNRYFDIVDFRHETLKIEIRKAKNPPKADFAVDRR